MIIIEYGVFRVWEANEADPKKAVRLYKRRSAAENYAKLLEGLSHMKHGEEGYTGYMVRELTTYNTCWCWG